MSFLRIDHVQITAPRMREREARHFYGTVLGLKERHYSTIPFASSLCFELGDATELHVVLLENPFRPPLGDHFALAVDDLEAVKARLAEHRVGYDGHERIFVRDPFGNRMEFIGRGNGPSPEVSGWS